MKQSVREVFLLLLMIVNAVYANEDCPYPYEDTGLGLVDSCSKCPPGDFFNQYECIDAFLNDPSPPPNRYLCCKKPGILFCPDGSLPYDDPNTAGFQAFVCFGFNNPPFQADCPSGYECTTDPMLPDISFCCAKEEPCDGCNRTVTTGFQGEYKAEDCCFFWGVNVTCSGCCKSSYSSVWILGEEAQVNEESKCCRPSGRRETYKTYKICLNGPDLPADDACDLPGLQGLPPWFTCTEIVYQVPASCTCRPCNVISVGPIDSTINPATAEFYPQPSAELLQNKASSFIKAQEQHMQEMLKAMEDINN